MKIARVESLIYGVEDVDTGIRYYEDWGLACVERGARGAEFRMPSGQSILIRPATDAALPAAPDGGSTLREAIWGVDDAASLEAIGAELGRDREVKADAQGGLHARDEAGFAIGFRPRSKAAITGAAAASRMNRPFDPERRARPTRLGHIVYNIRRQDIEKVLGFYLERLQFRLTDRALDTGAFMRCAGSTDHQSLLRDPPRPGVVQPCRVRSARHRRDHPRRQVHEKPRLAAQFAGGTAHPRLQPVLVFQQPVRRPDRVLRRHGPDGRQLEAPHLGKEPGLCDVDARQGRRAGAHADLVSRVVIRPVPMSTSNTHA